MSWLTKFTLTTLVGVVGLALFIPHTRAATRTWTNAAGGDFNTAGNWGTVPVAADTGVFNLALSGDVTLSAPATPGSLSFDTNASSFALGTLGGNSLTFANNGSLSVLATLSGLNKTFTVNAPIVLSPASTTTAGTFTIQNSALDATNTLVVAGGISSALTSNTESLTLGGTNTGRNTISGVISNGSATTFALNKAGLGLWTLTADNTFNGVTSVGTAGGPGGTLQLDGSTGKLSASSGLSIFLAGSMFIDGDTTTAANNNGVSNRINSAATLTISGGTFQLAAAEAGQSHSQAFSTLTLNGSGFSTLNASAATGTNTVTFTGAGASVYTRGVGAQLNIDTQSGLTVAFTNAITGSGQTGSGADAILNGATLNGTDFIKNAAGNVGVADYTDTGTSTWTAGKNMNVTGSNSTAYTAASINSVRFNASGANTVTLDGSHTIPNILVTSAVGNNLTTITGGTLIAPGTRTLDIFQNNTSGGLTIESAIADNSTSRLAKGGLGLVTLAGANTYAGSTFVHQGTLALTGSITNTGGITVNAEGTFNESSTGVISGAGGITVVGNATLSGNNTYTGTTSIGFSGFNNASLNINSATALGSTSAITFTSGTLVNTTGSAITQGSNPTVGLSGNFAFGSGTGVSSDLNLGTGAVTLSSSRTLTLNGASALTLGGLLTNTSASTANLTVNNGSGTTGSTNLNLTGGIGLGTGTSSSGTTFSGSANINIGGVIGNGTGSGTNRPLTYSGTGVLTLSAANTYTGTTSVTNGTLVVKNSGSGLSQTLAALTLAGPDVIFKSDQAGTGTLSTTFSSLTARAPGNTTNFISTGGTNGTSNSVNITGQAAGFIDKGVFFNGADFAAMDATGTFVRGLNYGVDPNTVAVDTVTASRHVKLTSSPASQAANTTLLSLNLAGSGVNYTLNSGTTLTAPGIIKSGGGSTSTISGGTAVTAGTNTVFVVRTDTTDDQLVISSALTQGSGQLTKSGAGTLTLSGTNTYTGVTDVNGGTLSIGSNVNLGSQGTGAALNLKGATLQATGTFGLFNGTTGTNNRAVGLTNASSFDVTGSNTLTVAGVVSGTGSFTKTNTGTLSLTGTNTYTGGTNISAGTVNFTADGLSTSGAVTFTGNSTLQYGAATTTDLSSRLVIGNGITGTVDTNGNNVTFATSFGASGSGALTKIGTGTLSLNAANTFTGLTTVNAGTLAVGSGGSLFSGNALTLDASGLATFANVGQTLGAVSNANTTSNALNFTASTGTVTLASLTGAGDTRFGSNGIVTGGIGSGTVTSIGNFTANISGGAATVGGVATIGTLSGGTANLNGATSAITTLNGGTVNLGASTTLSVSGGTSAGVIAGTGGSLTKTGSGTLTLTGASTYTGTTTVSAGTLTLHAASGATLANTTAVVVANGATVSLSAANQINSAATLTLNGGTLALNGFNQTLGTLDLNASSALNLSGSSALVFADSSALDWNSATFSLSHFEVGTNSLRFGTTSGGLTSTQLGLFRFVEFGNATALIDANGFLAPTSSNFLNTGSSDLTIATAITGTTTVDQTGGGSITLTGVNTSSGTATVTAGTLVIGTAAGGNWAGNVTVGGNGILKGRGDIGGAVVINAAGTYSPGNSPAIQNVGSLTVNSGGFVTIELDGETAGTGGGFHDKIVSTGAVTLNGGTLNGQTIFSGSSGYLPTLGAVHAVITGSAVTGSFAAYDFSANPAGVSFLPEYTATAVNLYAVPSDYATAVAGLSPNQTQVGAALQSLRLSRPLFELDQRTTLDARSALFNGLKTQNAAGLRTAYDQLTPEKLTALAATTFQSASILNSSLQQRSVEMRRFGAASVSLNGVARPAAAEDYRVEMVIDDGVSYQIAKAKPQKRYGYFASATGAFASVDGSSDRLGSFSQTGAATAGVDYALNHNQSVGLVVSQALADTDFSSNSGTARTTTSRFGVFHDYHNEGFFVNTAVSVGFSNYDSKRKIAFLNQTASGETQGLSYGGQLSTGYDFTVGGFILGPTASVAYDHAHIDSFDETGSAADLRVGRQNADSLITKFGVHISRPFVAKKIGWIPDLSLSASRQSFNPNSITARLAAGGDAFRVNPQAGGSEYINPGASLLAILPNGWTVRLSYDAILNPQSAEHRVNLSVGAEF